MYRKLITEKNSAGGGRPVFFRKRDIGVVLAALAAGGFLLAAGLCRGGGGARARVENSAGPASVIRLDADGLHTVRGALPVTLEVKNGAVRFINSVCPDHNCERFGWLRRGGDWALCAPAGVMVRVEED